MRWFNLIPGGGEDRTPANALEGVADGLHEAGARRIILIVEDAEGVTITHTAAPGVDSSPKATADLLLRVALDAKSVTT